MKKLTKFEVGLIKNGKESDPESLLKILKTVNDGGNVSVATRWDLNKVKLAQRLARDNELKPGRLC